jgi:hypothetical protein
MTEAIAGGFRSHFVDDGASVLRSVITAGRKPIEEKLGKVGESFMEYVTSKFSDEELLDMYKEVKSLNSAAEKSLTAEDRVSLEKWALDQGVAKAQGYEAAWAGLEALIDRYMNKKSRGSYQSAEVVMAAVFGDSPEIGAELVGGYYGVSDETSPQAFQLEFYHRMQGILARKDEDYYFRGSDTEAGNRKTKDLFSEFMKKLGVNDLSTLANVPYAVGATRHLSKYEGLRRTALREKAVAKVPARHVEEVRRYIAAQEMARASVATDAGSMIGFDTSVLGEYGFSAEPRFVLERRDSVESRLSSRSAFDLSEGFEARTEVAATGGGVRTPASIGALPAMPEVLQDETELVSGSGTPRSGASTPLRRVSVDSEDPVSLGDMVIPALDALGETLAAETAAVEEHGSSHPKPDLARSNLMAAIRQRKPAEEEVRPAVTAGEATARETGVAATAREVDASETRPVDTSGEAAVAEPPTQGVQRGFLADIRKGGFKLKSTKKPSAEAPGAGEDAIAPAERPPVRAPAADPRSGLLSAIRGGEARLKALPEEDPRMKPKPGVSSGKPASLQDIMRQAMQTRRGMLGEGRAGEDSDSDSDSDWSGSR